MEIPPLVRALTDPARHGGATKEVRVVETHISWVLLTGSLAYKIKKPVDLGFLDFSTLEKRRFYCEEEVRLNRRLAPELYLGVVRITGSSTDPHIEGEGDAVEYAVRMREFPQDAQLDRMLARGEMLAVHVDALVASLAAFHHRAAVAGQDTPFGDPGHVREPMRQNFAQLRARLGEADHARRRRLEDWTEHEADALRGVLERRKAEGHVRECHGDCHLGNMAWLDGRVVLFDCIEFNENLRWIDVMSELAFVVMDLDDRARPDLARRALNAYLELTGDYGGLALLRLYRVYRALVRAKVAAIRLSQPGLTEPERMETRRSYEGYAELAEGYTRTRATPLFITHGLSGSGKTYFTQRFLEHYDAIRLRSDIERKRLHGLAPLARSGSPVAQGLYATDASARTYEHLAELAETVLLAGYPVVVDAAFLKRAQRDCLRSVAAKIGAPFAILNVVAPDALLRQRLGQRERAGRDASEAGLAVLEHQLKTREPLSPDEGEPIVVDGRNPEEALEPYSRLSQITGYK